MHSLSWLLQPAHKSLDSQRQPQIPSIPNRSPELNRRNPGSCLPHLLLNTFSEVKPDSIPSHHQPPPTSPKQHQVTDKSLPTLGSSWEPAALEKMQQGGVGGGKKSLAHKCYLFLIEQSPGVSWQPSHLQSYVRFLPSIGVTRLFISNQSRGRRRARGRRSICISYADLYCSSLEAGKRNSQTSAAWEIEHLDRISNALLD